MLLSISNDLFNKILQTSPEKTYKIFINTCEKILIHYNSEGLKILSSILENIIKNTCNDNKNNDYYISQNLCLLSRFMIQFPSEWILFLKNISSNNLSTINQICSILTDKYITYYETTGSCIVDSNQKILWIFSILSLITTTQSNYIRIGEILDEIYSLLYGEKNELLSPDTSENNQRLTNKEIIENLYIKNDPLKYIQPKEIISQAFIVYFIYIIQRVKNQLGDEKYNELLTTFDELCYKNILKLLQ